MPMLIPAAWLVRWAALKALGWAGLGRWLAHRTGGALTGSWAWAVVACCELVGGLVLWRWIDPPERSYTAAEVRADRQQRIIDALQQAADVKDRIIAERGKALADVENDNRRLADDNDALRARAPAASGDAFTDADPWLQRKRARSGKGRARPGGG